MTPLHGIACFYDVGFGARAVSRKTPIYFIFHILQVGGFSFYILQVGVAPISWWCCLAVIHSPYIGKNLPRGAAINLSLFGKLPGKNDDNSETVLVLQSEDEEIFGHFLFAIT